MKNLYLLLLCFYASFLQAQEFGGTWIGAVSQPNKGTSFPYELTLHPDGLNAWKGEVQTGTSDGKLKIVFEVVARYDGDSLSIQEWKQRSPEAPKWCLKNMRGGLLGNKIQGVWTAKGCGNGIFSLERPNSFELPKVPSITTKDNNASLIGKWTGHLGQSDRDYGFYLEFDVREDGTGTAYISSEEQGGDAKMPFQWQYAAANASFTFQETGILEKSNLSWKWCIKKGVLKATFTEGRGVLTGPWEGIIEGYTTKKGACAPGTLYLEHPMWKKSEKATAATSEDDLAKAQLPAIDQYQTREKRAVHVGRIVDVQSRDIKIKVWDNGIVDGDVMSLVLNGQMIIKDHRVTKQKYIQNVRLEAQDNVLILHALDLGDIKPNTVAVSVDDGIKDQIVIVSSNLTESGAVMIRWFKIGEE